MSPPFGLSVGRSQLNKKCWSGGGAAGLILALVSLGTAGCGTSELSTNSVNSFSTAQVSLTAEEVTIEAANQNFTPTEDVLVTGWRDPANQQTQLELSWDQHDVDMRLHIDFVSDGTSWWADQVRTYDGQPSGEWRTEEGPFFETLIGEAFTGDINTEHVTMTGVQLEAFTTPPACIEAANPLALVPLAHEVQGWNSPGDGASVAVMIVSTDTCEPQHNLEHIKLEAESGDKDIIDAQPFVLARGFPSAELIIRGSGTTSLTVTAIDSETEELIDEITIPVEIRQNPEPDFRATTSTP